LFGSEVEGVKAIKGVLAGLMMGAVVSAHALPRVAAEDTAVQQLVQNFLSAEKAYDAASLSRLISESYVEVSPAGEVDEHDRFLGFYAPEKKTDWPSMSTSDINVRLFGDTAIEVVKFTYQMPGPGGTTRTMEIRGSFIAQKEHGTWKLLGAHYTGIRPPQANS
jgi:ketosteroid isomerase-like protein